MHGWSPGRLVAGTAAVVLTAGLVVGGAIAYGRLGPDDEDAVATASSDEATVERSDLTESHHLTGVVEVVSSLTVTHRTADSETSDEGGAAVAVGSIAAAVSDTVADLASLIGSRSGLAAGPIGAFGSGARLTGATASSATTVATTTTTAPAPTTTTSTPGTTTTTGCQPGSTTSTSTPATSSTTAPGCEPPTTTSTTATTSTTEPGTTPTTPTTGTTGPVPATTTTSAPGPTPTTTPGGSGPATGGPGRTVSGGPAGSFSGGEVPSGAAGDTTGGPGAAPGAAPAETFVVTSLAPDGTVLRAGDVLYSADGSPVVAMDGAVPAWRTMSTGSADGVDVEQLERNLVALGYGDDGLVVDGAFTDETAAAVEAWQEGLGLESTGEVELGRVVFLPAAATVTGHAVEVGGTVETAGAVLTLATAARQVVVDVPVELQAMIVPGLAVDVSTGAGDVDGVVSVLRASTDADSGEITVQAIVSPEDEIGPVLAGSEAGVGLTVVGERGVLTVPTEAIASRLDGSYAVRLVGGDGTPAWVEVEVGGTGGQRTAVEGPGLEEGSTVLVPA